MKRKLVLGIMLTLLLIGTLKLTFNIQFIEASKSLAPNGVHDIATYESRIGEESLLLEDANLQMWVPKSFETHAAVIFDYLVAGYANLSSIFGDHEYPYKFSIEHYPEGSPYGWGGTDAQGTIRYGYSNLEDDTPEWNLHGVPHVIGYYEEMAHCFARDLGVRGEVSVGFYETLGMMIGGETTLRAAYNPYIEALIANSYQTYNETTSYYLEHDDGPPGIPENIWLTRVLAHIFKTEVVDMYGWDALADVFEALQDNYPLREYDRDHTWGGFLHYLGKVTTTDFHTVFGNYGLPIMTWTGESGYESDGVENIGNKRYRFKVKCFDREGTQPTKVQLHLYNDDSISASPYLMSFIGGDNETGWIYEKEVELEQPLFKYAFSADDGAHNIFQALGKPTVTCEFHAGPSVCACADVVPNTLNLKSKGRWITCYIELSEGYDVGSIDRTSVMLNDTISVDPFWVDKPLESVIGDYDDDGIADLMVKFDRQALIGYLKTEGVADARVTLATTGQANGTSFEATDTIIIVGQ